MKTPKFVTKAIIVNATALDRSGALSILKQFIHNIPENKHEWLVFIDSKINIEVTQSNVKLILMDGVKSMIKRIWWDYFGLNNFLKRHNIQPVACISLQNTNFRVSSHVPHFIYYHQSIPFYKNRWNPLSKEERTLWFYKNIYPLIVKLSINKSTKILVQLEYIKNEFSEMFNHPPENIQVFSPSVEKPDRTLKKELNNEYLNLFYPATNHIYKNHSIIIDAVSQSKQHSKLYLTLPSKASSDRIEHTGFIPRNEIFALYNSCDALLFPSYIETFGLPLIEAALTGIPIIASDLPYAREVLDGYEGVTFVKFDNVHEWSTAIDKLTKDKRYKPIQIDSRPSWTELFEYIDHNL